MQAVQTNGPQTHENAVGVEPPPTKWQSLGRIAGTTIAVLAFHNAKERYVPRDSFDTVVLNIMLLAGFVLLGMQWLQYRSDKIQRRAYRELTKTPPNKDELQTIAANKWSKSPERQYTHTHEFAIVDNFVWARSQKNAEEQWKRLYFPGMAHGVTPKEIRADGANLMIQGSDDRVYYKKVITEAREKEKYTWSDLTAKYNWIDTWFTLPVICEVGRILYTIPGAPSGLLTIPKNVKSWSMSHLGRFAEYYTDPAGNNHQVSTVTQVLAIFKGSNKVFWADPHIPGGFNYPPTIAGLGIDHSLPGPTLSGFVAKKIDSSGSLIVLTGKVDNVWMAFTCFTDFDIRGLNPTHHVTDDYMKAYFEKIRIGMPVNWIPVKALPKESTWRGFMQVMQTGRGNAKRQLFVKAKNPEGEKGIYSMELGRSHWEFRAKPTAS